MARRSHWEDREQRHVIDWLRIQHRPVYDVTFHVPNGGYRNKTEAAIMKGLGVKSGVADLICLFPVEPYHGLAIEMKAAPPRSSPVSDTQEKFLELVNALGYKAVVCKGFEEAKAAINDYLKPWREKQRANQ